MESAISAIIGDLISRVVSFLFKKYSDNTAIDQKLEKLQQILLRIHAVVEEADGRYITNPKTVMQLKILAESMYKGYHVLDKFRHPYVWTPAEKQQIISVLLNYPGSGGGPVVLPVIGGCRVGKKTLVAHVCRTDRVQSYFSSILFKGDSIWRTEHAKFSNKRTLAVVELLMGIDDDDWVRFYKTVAHKVAEGSKVIIISRIQNLARFGTVKAVLLNSLTREEYTYLFKRLSFGSTDENEYPYLASIANEVAVVLRGSLITASVVADLLRKKLDVQYWLHIFRRFKGLVDNNLSKYGEHPKDILENERPIDITALYSSRSAIRCLMMPPRVEEDCPKRKLAHIPFGGLVAGNISLPNDEFVLATWESRIAPYTRYLSDVPRAEDKRGPTACARKRRYRA